MAHSHLLALAGAVILVAALALVPDPNPVETAEVAPAPELDTEPPTTFAVVLAAETPGGEELAQAEETLTAKAIATTTTTTTPAPSTSTEPASTPKTPAPTPTTPTTTQPTTPPTTVQEGFNSSFESDFRGKINSLRSSNGLPNLSSNGSLNARARDWARTMAEANKLMHSNISNLLPPWSAAGENVGKGASVSSIFGSLSGSSSHRGNMLGDYTDFGVGVWVDNSGSLWTVHVFTR